MKHSLHWLWTIEVASDAFRADARDPGGTTSIADLAAPHFDRSPFSAMSWHASSEYLSLSSERDEDWVSGS